MSKKALLSTQFKIDNTTFIFELKKITGGSEYLKITESKTIETGSTQRKNIIIQEKGLKKFEEAFNYISSQLNGKGLNSYTLEQKREVHSQAYYPWTSQADHQLEIMFCEGKSIKDLAELFGRNDGAIRSRIKKLELKEKYGF